MSEFQPETYEESYVTFTFLWHSMGDACQQCLHLNGREWVERSIFDEILWDEFWGDIYDLNLGLPLTHGGSGKNCRCTLEGRPIVQFREIREVEELSEFMRILGI